MFPPRGRRLAGRRAVTIRARQLGLNRPLNSRNGVNNAKLYHHRERPGPVEYRPRLLRTEKSWVNPNLRRKGPKRVSGSGGVV